MPSFSLITTSTLVAFNLVFFSCGGTTYHPSFQVDNVVVAPGSDVELAWSFDYVISDVEYRAWTLVDRDMMLADIFSDMDVNILEKRLPRFEVKKPSTLVLRNVDLRHNGTYEFLVSTGEYANKSYATVFVTVKPNVSVCPSPIMANDCDDVTCLCKGSGGNPPGPLNVTWYKNGVQISETSLDENALILKSFKRKDSGIYTCRVQNHPRAKNETSVDIMVAYSPEKPKLMAIPEVVEFGKSVTIVCVGYAVPSPNYAIMHNNEIVSVEEIYTIAAVKHSHAGSYICLTTNKLGNNSRTFNLTIVGPAQKNGEVGVIYWQIIASLMSAFLMGTIFSYIMFRCCCRNRKPHSKGEPRASQVESIYQEVDLKKNSEDNYESLTRVFSGKKEAVYYENDPTYSELSKIRDGDNTYQQLKIQS